MINYKYKLPSMWACENGNGNYNNEEMVLPSFLSTTSHELGDFLHILHNIIADSRKLLFVDNKVVPVLHNWIRDDVHMMKGAKHYEYRLKDFLEFIIDNQSEEGFYYELVKQLDDGHQNYVDASCSKIFEDDNVALVRLELEADVEYLVVEGVLQYYKTSGDIDFVKKVMPSLEKAINYMITLPKRFSKKHGLVMRPYTIDTWDFVDNPRTKHDRRIHDDEPMCIMHGDNSGVYQAMMILSYFNKKLHLPNEKYWLDKANEIKDNMFKYLWNGKFFVHQLPVNCKPIDDKENVRLSLSNPYDINRGVTNLSQAASIINEYQERKKTTDAFLEYFSIEPPYPKFHVYPCGQYVNGAISPFTAGELALASFDNGFEKYGYEIVKNMMNIALKNKSISFLYDRDYKADQNTMGPSAWGAAALLNAIDEGLMGIKDLDCLYKDILFSPKLVVTEYEQVRYFTGYEQDNIFLDLRYTISDEGFRYDLHAKDVKNIKAEILIPQGKSISRVELNGKKIEFDIKSKNDSKYICFECKNDKLTSIVCYY